MWYFVCDDIQHIIYLDEGVQWYCEEEGGKDDGLISIVNLMRLMM